MICNVCLKQYQNDGKNSQFQLVDVTVTNWCKYHGGYQLPIVYMKSCEPFLNGFHTTTVGEMGGPVCIQPVSEADSRELQTGSSFVWLIELHTTMNYMSAESRREAKVTYDYYCMDIRYNKLHGCDYTEYVTQVIDYLIEAAGDAEMVINNDISNEVTYIEPNVDTSMRNHLRDHSEGASSVPPSDYNDPNKRTGNLTLQGMAFTFIGPDRPVKFDCVEQYFGIEDTILSTGLPNYKMARYPIQSELNLPAWEEYLREYPDQRVIQYLKFGFPLSINSRDELHVDIKNHFSVVQYPEHVQDYIDTGRGHGALLGKTPIVTHPQFH